MDPQEALTYNKWLTRHFGPHPRMHAGEILKPRFHDLMVVYFKVWDLDPDVSLELFPLVEPPGRHPGCPVSLEKERITFDQDSSSL